MGFRVAMETHTRCASMRMFPKRLKGGGVTLTVCPRVLWSGIMDEIKRRKQAENQKSKS